MDWFDVAKTITQPPVRDEVADGLNDLVSSLGRLASDLEKLADDLGAARSELTKEAA